MYELKAIQDLDIHISDGNYSSKYPRSNEFVEAGVPFIRANNLLEKTISPRDMYFISPEKHTDLKKGHLRENDVLITTRGNLGTTAIVPEAYEDANINAQLVLLRANPQSIDPHFLLRCFDIHLVKSQITRLQTGTALKQLPIKRLVKIEIPLPPLAEQKRIAAILDKADALRTKRRAALASCSNPRFLRCSEIRSRIRWGGRNLVFLIVYSAKQIMGSSRRVIITMKMAHQSSG